LEVKPQEHVMAMSKLTKDEIKKVLGPIDDVTVANVIATGATAEELEEAYAWFANNEAMMNAGRALPQGRAGELVGLFESIKALEDEDPARPG